MSVLTVERLYKEAGKRLGLKLVGGGKGLGREVKSALIQKAGLALTGLASIDPERVQVLGETEMKYLSALSDEVLELRLRGLFETGVPCYVVTRNQDIPPLMLRLSDETGAALFRTNFDSDEFMVALSKYFEEAFSRFGTVHGVLVEVFGVGILIIGASGVGKSELALDLVCRGHRMVADDVIDVTVAPDSRILGSGSHLIKHHMEVRGLGIINIRDLFGVAAVRERHTIDLVVELVDWDQRKEYDEVLGEGNMRLVKKERKKVGGALPENQVTNHLARKFFIIGLKAEREGDLAGAQLNYKFALDMEEDNEVIAERMARVTKWMGGAKPKKKW